MKFFVTAMTLLVLATPALASPRHPTPAQWRDIETWEAANGACFYRTDPEAVKKGCAAADRLRKKLEPQGFCFYGHGVVGRTGGTHCYELLKRPRAQKWFLEITIYPVDNRGGVHWNDPEKKRYLNHAFDTSSECRTRWRVFRKQCEGLIADNEDGGGFTREFTGVCRRFRQQPEPVLKPYAEDDYSGSAAAAKIIKREQECAK